MKAREREEPPACSLLSLDQTNLSVTLLDPSTDASSLCDDAGVSLFVCMHYTHTQTVMCHSCGSAEPVGVLCWTPQVTWPCFSCIPAITRSQSAVATGHQSRCTIQTQICTTECMLLNAAGNSAMCVFQRAGVCR